jgi:hypothetical protein
LARTLEILLIWNVEFSLKRSYLNNLDFKEHININKYFTDMITKYFKQSQESKWQDSPPLHFTLCWNNGIPLVSSLDSRHPNAINITSVRMKSEPWGHYTPTFYFDEILEIGSTGSKRNARGNAFDEKESLAKVAFLKSNLQKAIRRRETAIAVKSTKVLMELSTGELLRRLPVIIVEDVGICSSISVLVWLLAVTCNGYELQKHEKDYILGIVCSLCSIEYQDVPDKRDVFHYQNRMTMKKWNAMALNDCKKSGFLAMYIRVNYGGSKGDMEIFRYFMEKCIDGNAKFIEENIVPIDSNDLKCNFTIHNDVIISAIDFHIYPEMLSNLSVKLMLEKQTIKDAIWWCESGVNLRNGAFVPHDLEKHLKVYNVIKRELMQLKHGYKRMLEMSW